MDIRLSVEDVGVVRGSKDDIVLGILFEDGTVRLHAADAVMIQGHADWVRRERFQGIYRGFNLLCREGEVREFCRVSGLNPAPSYRIEQEYLQAIKRQLPLSHNYGGEVD